LYICWLVFVVAAAVVVVGGGGVGGCGLSLVSF